MSETGFGVLQMPNLICKFFKERIWHFSLSEGTLDTTLTSGEEVLYHDKSSATELNTGSFTFLYNFSTQSNMHYQNGKQQYRYTICVRCKVRSEFLNHIEKRTEKENSNRKRERKKIQKKKHDVKEGVSLLLCWAC